ncbi:efflux transporter outer membrane subunit [Xanthomonas massiliensis]|uniref:efflux transporter outer membrane subunit n=1 Tax=Xanthomonas massiliensis TaxID=1720302 RepID=UPI000825A5DC|nr:efflux transporter outer membrane subunit [Xanthomonas massiliensis]
MTHPLSRKSPRLPLRPLALAALALALGACASSRGLSPQGRLLDAGTLHGQQRLAGATLSPAAWPQAQWWKALGDPQLDQLVDEALRGSPDLAVADARLAQARASAGQADAERGPSLGVSAGYTGLRLPESMVGSEMGGHYAGTAQAMVSFSYGVDLWGGKRAAWEAAVGRSRAAEVDAQAARLDLAAAVVQAYVQLDLAWRQADIAEQDLERSNGVLALTRQRRDAGIDNDLQLRQAQGRVPAAQQQLQQAHQAMDQARTALAALLGQGPDRGLGIERPALAGLQAPGLPSVLPSELLGHRPDVVAARWRVEAAGQGIKAAKAQFYPSFNLSALGGVVNKNVGDLLEAASTFAYIGPAFSLPLFDAGRLRAGLAGRDADYDLAVADYNRTLVQALRQVADQVTALQSLQAQTASQQSALDAAQAAFALAQRRYKAGIGNYLDVLSAQQQVLSAQQALARIQSEARLAAVQLTSALGGGYDPAGMAQAPAAHDDLPNS